MSRQASLPPGSSILDRLAFLPAELQVQILFEVLTVSSPCAMSLFVPDWGVCSHTASPVNAIYDLQRIDVYIKGAAGVRGRFETRVKHDDRDHIWLPLMEQANAGALVREFKRRFPAAMELALQDLEQRRLRSFEQLWPKGPDDEIGRCMAGGALVFRECDGTARGTRCDDGLDTGGPTPAEGAVLPRHMMLNGVPRDPWQQLRLRRNALTKYRLEMRIFVERGAELLAVDWAAMTLLETLFIDLRAYGRDRDGEDGIRLGAAGMGCLQLRCLVVAGLRSDARYARPAGWRACDWEADETEVDGGVNWVKVFRGAVREGGRLVFVDRRMLDISWEAWGMRAEKEGLLVLAKPEGDGEVKDQSEVVGEFRDAAYLRHVDRVLSEGK
ncbi:hypothetical protein CH063_15596 [Colletotrichum higginsianum]|uniref:Urea transport protein n=2 Tax=Colletotrichum higginsianum TaxID=80884 RepID=H1W3J8_COLHI|nr:Urea transport protein [Colletotrichum higginsianum IMI 349063]OBR04919.1 Urea transport protein [Colletotrichum higginsianum IMI 349063]TIC93647.1 hypothetical protein CH35J_009336 [Colletotrichum higginsianum]CCF47061.1 hypothetical protein CH063_15596 [Colletotrichum higginsianum]